MQLKNERETEKGKNEKENKYHSSLKHVHNERTEKVKCNFRYLSRLNALHFHQMHLKEFLFFLLIRKNLRSNGFCSVHALRHGPRVIDDIFRLKLLVKFYFEQPKIKFVSINSKAIKHICPVQINSYSIARKTLNG